MPYEKGGRADKKGNKYEINCIVYELLKVLDGSNYSVVIEALGEDEKGTDILVTNHEGKKEHQQCKARNGSSDNWTISDLKARKIFNAWKIQLDRECDRKVALVSPMTCSFLVDLNDRANNTSGKADEFYDFQIMNSSKEFQSFYENFCKEMNIEIGRESGILKSIDYLKRIYYKQISEYEIQELITQNIQYQFSSPKDMVYDAFVSMIVSKDILGRELTQIALIDYIEKKNIKFQLREDDGRIGFRIKELNQEYRESFRTLQEGLIHRKEFDNCIKYIMDGKGVVITGNAGYGKSGCTEAILNFCEDANIPCIAIKLDRRIPHKNCKNWGEELGLPGSIAYCIHTISRNENAIIILDQLDALRWTQSNSSEALSICMELIRQVECLNYNRAKKISIVFVCRTYDFENDNNIRALFENREREEEIWKVIEIGKFEEETVGRIVGDIYKDLSVKLKNLLQIPSNLYIWQHLDKKQIYGECLTTSNLIDKWFDQICKRSTEVGISSKLVADTTNKIVDTLDGMNIKDAVKMAFTGRPQPIEAIECPAHCKNPNLYIIPGHMDLSEFESSLSLAINSNNAIVTLQNLPGAFYELIKKCCEKYDIDYVFIDMNPGLSAINQTFFAYADAIIVPANPDPFSTMALKTLKQTLPKWKKWAIQGRELFSESSYPLPECDMKFIGEIIQRFNLRNHKAAKPYTGKISEIKNYIETEFISELSKFDMWNMIMWM